MEKKVINWTFEDNVLRTEIRVGVAYGSPTDKVAQLISQAVSEQAEVLSRPAPVVLFKDFGNNALQFEVMFWIRIQSNTNRLVIESDIRYTIDRLFRENGVTIAFPQRDVHLGSLKPLEVKVLK